MELNGDVVDVSPGSVVYIEPNTRHRLWSEKGVRTVVFGVPAWNPEDEYFDQSWTFSVTIETDTFLFPKKGKGTVEDEKSDFGPRDDRSLRCGDGR